jgi:hypothetical protein
MGRHHAGAAVLVGGALAAAIVASGRGGVLQAVAATPDAHLAASTTQTQSTSSTTTDTTTTRTESNPAFVGPPPTSAAATAKDLKAAVARLAKAGYPVISTATFKGADALRVLIGAAHSGSGRRERAFFFDLGTFVGNDAPSPSQQIAVAAQNDTEVTIRYSIFTVSHGTEHPDGSKSIRFELEGGRLDVLEHLPSAAQRR